MRRELSVLLVAVAFLTTVVPAHASDALIVHWREAGKLLYEETAGDIGCLSCHGAGATGTELAPDIRGADETAIMRNLRINGNMTFLALSTEDVEQLAVYLAWLEDHPDR